MICPIMSVGRSEGKKCIEENCAWWIAGLPDICAIKDIAFSLEVLATKDKEER